MKYLRKFDSVSDMEAAVAADEISFIGMAKSGDNTEMAIHTHEVIPPTNLVISCASNTVTITATNATTIEYNFDGSDTYTTYTQPFEISETVTVYAKASNSDGSITGSKECEWVNPIDYSIPFYIDVRGAVALAATSGLQMSTDMTNWTDTTATTLSSGKTYFRVASDQSSRLKPAWTENDSSDYDIGGNINSLCKVDFENVTSCYNLKEFFKNKTKLKSASGLILPATTLANNCYEAMFSGCTSLTTAPALPATTLGSYCYQQMFDGCTSLTTAPALPATNLYPYCYFAMFNGCKSLTTAPALPATKLTQSCYASMFYNCTNLNYIKCLATNISASNCTSNWVSGVSKTGTFVKNPIMSGWKTGANGIPSGWTVEDAAE